MKYKNLTGRCINLHGCKFSSKTSKKVDIVSGHHHTNIESHILNEQGIEGVVFMTKYFISIEELERTGQLTEKDLNEINYEIY